MRTPTKAKASKTTRSASGTTDNKATPAATPAAAKADSADATDNSTTKEVIGLTAIAKATGFSRMTVSRALRSMTRVKPTTLALIQKTAARLGYVPDARMAAVMSGMRMSKRRELLPIAWLNTAEERGLWRKFNWLSPYLEGAQKECTTHGFKLEEHWLMQPGMTQRRMSQILASRGIRGVIITPATAAPGIHHLRLKWEQFSVVTFENGLLSPRLNKVVPHFFHNLMLALKNLRRLGYRRIGLCLQTIEEQRSGHTYLAALGYFQNKLPAAEHVRPFVYRRLSMMDKRILESHLPLSEWMLREKQEPHGTSFTTDAALLRKWIERERPDVIVGQHSFMLNWLAALDLRVPQDIGVAHLALDDDCADWAGIWQNKREIGAQAVRQVIGMLHANERGIPKITHETFIHGEWRFGRTLKHKAG
ncbi:LacI family DNA-binding transcriptional regulator [Geminisphaera colitermitum]|uniref:LacI family DNA-binding transcriptional regulator n=1 Tax=Geminisphaera colitermitum TaxID=1148786 RepID=UPI000158C585|nr:LacI family DNA-binding transcriptional regulator [Geminisphaera colitermitum]